MTKPVKTLKISLFMQMALGVLAGAFMGFFLGVMAMDAPSSTYVDMLQGAALGFGLAALPTVPLPLLALRELNNYRPDSTPYVNFLNSAVACFFVFLPLGIWQFYLLYQLKRGARGRVSGAP